MSCSMVVLGLLTGGEAPSISNIRPMQRWKAVSDLTFNGSRFDEASMELDIAQELVSFQRLVTRLATELYYAENSDAGRLPNGFAESIRLRFHGVVDGSARFPLEAQIADDPRNPLAENLFGVQPSPYVQEAIDLLLRTIKSQEVSEELPRRFPREMVGDLATWGGTLLDTESITISEKISAIGVTIPATATFTTHIRKKLREYAGSNYEDVITLLGEIRAVDLDNSSCRIRLPNQTGVQVRFSVGQQSAFQSALSRSVAVTGLAEISAIDGVVKKISNVTDLAMIGRESDIDSTSLSTWLQEARLNDTWNSLPADFSAKLDGYIPR